MQGRPEAAAAVWRWRNDGDPASGAGLPDGRRRVRGSLQAAVGLGVGATIFLLWSQTAGAVVMGIATLILLAALLSPSGAFALLERAFSTLGAQIARLITFVTMSLIFYLIFAPFGVLTRRGRRDPMRRFYEPDGETYWTPREIGRAGSPSRQRQY